MGSVWRFWWFLRIERCSCELRGELRGSDCFGKGSGGLQRGNAQRQRDWRPHLPQGVLFPAIGQRKRSRHSHCLVCIAASRRSAVSKMDSDSESLIVPANEFVQLWDDLTLWLRRNIGSKGKRKTSFEGSFITRCFDVCAPVTSCN